MPIISRFLGISASMYYLDHDPPHFHVAYGGFRATVGIWERARRGEPLLPITPLE